MPRYFIDVRSRFGYHEDLEGISLPSASVARGQALKMATLKFQDTWQDLPAEAKNNIAIEIVGEAGQTVLVVSFSEIEQHLKAAQLLEGQRPSVPMNGWSLSASMLLGGAVLWAGTATALALVLI